MSPPAPSRQAGEPVNLSITANGTALDTDRIVSVETWWEANKLPRARIVLFDGQPATGKFPFSEGADFVPGADIVIACGYKQGAKTVHTGKVVRHALEIVPGESARLVIETADPLIQMTLSRSNAITAKASDKALIATLVGNSGGSIGKNEARTDAHEAFVQWGVSDWDLMRLRAEAGGCVVIVEAGKADIVAPSSASSSPVLTLAYGDSIIAFDAAIDAVAPLAQSAVSSQAWSYDQQQRVAGSASGSAPASPGNLSPATLAGTFSVSSWLQQTGASLAEAELAGWSSAAEMRSALAAVRGSAEVQGNADVKPGTLVALAGLGARFNGNAWVSSVRHVVRDGAWRTAIGFGMAAESFASRADDLAMPGAAGLNGAVKGLQIGQVTKVAADPAGDFRVEVSLPLLGASANVWARLAQPYASSGFGIAFFPEVGDEVLLGFMEEDPSSPVVLGALYSSQRAPTFPPDEADKVKAIVTRSKMHVKFDDDSPLLEISTPGGRIVRLDDKEGTITVTDGANKMVMDSSKVEISSAGDLNLSAANNVTIKSGLDMTVTGGTKFALSSPQIQQSASGTLSISSSGIGELKASGPLTISGAIVKIN
jgi:Rhs element Vgr protein